jgi:uncharacterized OB-fold protein
MSEKYIIYPEIDQDSQIYWQSLCEHAVRLQKCHRCGRFRFPPYPTCYYCGEQRYSWVAISGRGKLYSWIVIHHPIDTNIDIDIPFVVALVTLEEGPRITARLINCKHEDIRGDMPLTILYEDISDQLTILNVEPCIES